MPEPTVAASEPRWRRRQTQPSNTVEEHFRNLGYQNVDAYSINPNAIRLRILDPRFTDRDHYSRVTEIQGHLKTLPGRLYKAVTGLFLFTPAEIAERREHFRPWFMNVEFEDPTR